jgi:hypothetical protein
MWEASGKAVLEKLAKDEPAKLAQIEPSWGNLE